MNLKTWRASLMESTIVTPTGHKWMWRHLRPGNPLAHVARELVNLFDNFSAT